MQDVVVKLLSGAQFSVQCSPDDTLAQLRRRLEEQREGLRRCKLNLRGAFLDDTVTVAELVLQPGDFLVAFETRRKARQAAPAAPHVAPPPVQLTPAAARLQCEASGPGGQLQQSPTVTPPSSPRQQQWAAHGGGPGRHVPPLGSPGMPDSLLPGYLSRPNPSPVKARLHQGPPAAAASHQLPPDKALAVPGRLSDAQQPSAQPARARQSLSLLDLAEQRFGGGAGGGEVAPSAWPRHEPCIQQAKAAPALASQAPEASGIVLSFSQAEGAESSMLLPQGVDAASLDPQEPQPRRRAPMRGAGSKRKQPSSSVPAGATAHQQQQQQQHAASGPSHILPSAAAAAVGECQSRLLLSEAELDVAAAALPLPPVAQRLEAAFAVLAQVHAFLTGQHIQATWAHIRQSAAGLHMQQPLTLPDVRLAAAVCPELVSLQQHHRLEPRSRGDSWRLAVTSPHKARAVLAAAAAAEAAAGQQGQPLPNPMHLLTDGAGTVLGGGAAAGVPAVDLATGLASSTAAGGGGSAAGVNSAQLAADDTLVVEVADPGKGFLARPIPTAFLQHLRHLQSQAQPAGSSLGGSTTQEQDLCMAEGETEVELPGSGDEDGEEAALNINGSTQRKPTAAAAAVAAAAAAAGSAAGPQPTPAKRRQFRVNKAVRQRWCFRRALVRALLLLQQQHLDSPASAGGAEQQREGQQRQEQQRRRPRRGKGSAAAPSSLGGVVAPWQQGRWHPLFDPEAATSDQLAAAGNLLAAPLRAAAAVAEQEASAADALQAARRSRRRDAAALAAPAAAAAGGVAAGLLLAGAKPPQLLKQHAPCTDTTEMDTTQFLSHLKQLPWYQGQVQHTEQMPARRARHATSLTPLAPAVAAALQLRGVRQLFLHQAAAVDHLLQGRHTVVATSTASGKSLCYIIPLLQALAQDRSACALLMFPTKALAQDQLRALRELLNAAFGSGGEEGVPAVEVYDGDTPVAERGGVRDRAQLLITNPDMLHMSVLPVHPQFGRLLANLKYVVVDEGHAYKGVFGCHAALVLRRLRRLCDRVYHSQPTFAVTTATLANPREHALELLGVSEVEVVGEDGSPHGPRTFVMWNPPVLQPWVQGAQSRTESRAGGRRRAQQAQRLRQRQEANQERGAGVLDERPGVSQAQRLSDAKLNLRRQQLEAAVTGQQPELLAQEPEPPPQQQQQQHKLQLAADSPQHPENDARASRVPLMQHLPLRAPQQPTAALRREIAEAKAALAAVGGSQVRAAARAATRPLIRRQPVGARAALELLAVSSAAGGSRSGPSPPGQAASSSAATGEADDYRSRLPDNKDWKAAAQAAAGGKGLSGRDGNGRGSGRGRGSGAGGSRYQGRQERDSNIGDGDGEGVGEGDGDDDEDEDGDERRSSPIVELSLLLAECVQHGLRTIAFCKSRKLCELVTAYVREILKCTASHLTGSIAVYRAGYSPAERREIEGALFRGSLRAVAATNALELGVDVGSLDCTLHLGFPGSVASLWQQAGRAGRREQACLGIYLGWDGPLDQYFMRHPSQLFGRPIERAMVDARNPSVLEAHLTCAAAEAPLLLDMDQHFFGPDLPALAAALQRAALLGRHPMAPSPRVMHYVGAVTSPASKISLRAIDPERYAIVDESQDGQLLEEIEESKAFFQVYDGAVYMYQGRTYLCKKLDLDAKVAVVRPAEVKYYTKCIDFTDVHVRGGRPAFAPPAQPQAQPQAAAAAAVKSSSSAGNFGGGPGSSADQQRSVGPVAVCSPAVVTVRWLGFKRVWRGSGEVFDSVDLFLPDVQFDTEAAYCRLPHATRRHLKEAGLPFREGVHAACHALLNVLPLYLMCNPSDVATECDNPFDTRFKPERILIFDKHPGGIGLSAAAAPLFPELLRRALDLVRECACSGRSGCPACVQHTECNEYNAVLNKRAACVVLESLLRGEDGAE